MSLDEYRNKRNFQKSTEPSGEGYAGNDKTLRFVVHKHQASHLHYDLRLELNGVLKSWAVPKGIPLDTTQKRLAIMVEDHPIEYADFEGVIPKGTYGAGTVMLWDEGCYQVPGTVNKKEAQAEFSDSLIKGHAVFYLQGHKLKGSFILIRLKRSPLNHWMLVKKKDENSIVNVPIDQKSVQSGRTMDEIQSFSLTAPISRDHLVDHYLKDIPISIQPSIPIKPMLAELIEKPFNKKGWIFEIKWDGYRAIAEINKNFVKLYSRNGKSYNKNYPQIIDDLCKLEFEGIIDGELVVVDQTGRADFKALQNFSKTQKGGIIYYVFDILYLNKKDLRSLPLITRKKILKHYIPQLHYIRYNDHIEEFGIDFFQIAKENNIEGIMAKDEQSPYIENRRTRFWLKIKIYQQQEFVIGGFSEPQGSRKGIGALLVGVFHNGQLLYSGNVGGGFTETELLEIRSRLLLLRTSVSPFSVPPLIGTSITWVRPEIVCEVKFAEWTSDGLLRQPVFMGFRNDIDPHSVHREKVIVAAQTTHFATPSSFNRIEQINGRTLELTNLNKVFWTAERITKGALINYYFQIAPFILPYLKDRPQALHRFPDGIGGKHFYQKNIKDTPDWLKTISLQSESRQGEIRYVVCQDEASLIYIVNLGAIEINIWNSRIEHLHKPDYLVIDLDPLNSPFDDVIKTALSFHKLLDQVQMPHYVKTSGATGLHIFIPLNARYSFTQARQFSQIICTIINKLHPDLTSLERIPQKRIGKVYLDFLQNSFSKTMAAPYSVRPIPLAPVSTPLLWEELLYGIKPELFTMKTILSRLETYGDLWKAVLGEAIDIGIYLPRLKVIYSNLS